MKSVAGFTHIRFRRLLVMLCVSLIVACGNDKKNSSGIGADDWQQGVFRSAQTFKGYCNLLDENNYLRSWNNDTYLWFQDVDDQDPAGYSNPHNYFDQLKTTEKTASGKDKDPFHFYMDSATWDDYIRTGAVAGYGADFNIISSEDSRRVVVNYVQSGSPAEGVLTRGAEIVAVDGILVAERETVAENATNAGLYPQAGEVHQFEVRDVGAAQTRHITLQAQQQEMNPVPVVNIEPAADGAIGYLLFTSHNATAEPLLIDAIKQFSEQGISDLVLDLRYNGGGYLHIANKLAYMIAGSAQTEEQVFEKMRFNNKHPVYNPVTGSTLAAGKFIAFDRNGEALPSLNLTRVFVLTGAGTCSASESIINGLRGIDLDVIQIGATTCGKPYGFYAQGNCGTTYFTVQFSGENAKGFGDYADGFMPENTTEQYGVLLPGCMVEDDYSNALGDADEGLFAAALQYRQNGVCPPVAEATVSLLRSRSFGAEPRLEAPLFRNSKVVIEHETGF